VTVATEGVGRIAVAGYLSISKARCPPFLPTDFQPTTRPSKHTMADKLRAQQQLEALQARYIGIGSADTTKHEWTSNIARDSLSSFVGHPPLLQYMSIGLGQPREKTRVQLLERMVRPVGPPPEVSGRPKTTSECG
jgi:splicing factor 3B subunit 5